MKIRSAKYHFKNGVKGIAKNRLMSFASIISVSICCFMLVVSLTLALNLDYVLEQIEESIGISVYLGEDMHDEEITNLLGLLKKIPNVQDIEYMSKEDALNWAKDEWSDSKEILEGLEDDNPFPRSFELSIKGASNQKQVVQDLQKLQIYFENIILEQRNDEEEINKSILKSELVSEIMSESVTNQTTENKKQETEKDEKDEKVLKPGDSGYNYIGIEKIKHSQKQSDILLAINNVLRIMSIVLILIFSLISIAIIVNTIKLTVYVRKNEINIMKYVGATDWFIKWPFVIEGIIIGVIGSLIPIIVCVSLYKKVALFIYHNVPIAKNYLEFITTFDVFLFVAPVTLLLGVSLGAIGSVSSTKKYLKV